MYNLRIHKTLTEKKWDRFAPSQRILMIANELNRAKNAIIRKNREETRQCYERAMELLDLTISICPERNKRKELLRFREMLGLEYLKEGNKNSKVKMLTKILLLSDKEAFNSITN